MKKLSVLCVFILLFYSFSVKAFQSLSQVERVQGASLSTMLKSVTPAVVNIATYSTRQEKNPLLDDPFFRNFFDLQRKNQERRQQSAGSGVIVDAQRGIILTNFHVIDKADEIQVSLTDGRSFRANKLGSDPDLDIAVLQINAKNLMAVKIADSDEIEVGDFVVAIGNPFGLGQTVTTGIISALSRSGLGIEDYENFIQTDASINPGNSGGALVNVEGGLIGINTAIISPPGGGNVGIGFAIPSNMAKASMEQILKHGEVKRGQIGVSIQNITDELREAFQLKNGQQGVLVTGVIEQTPADDAGIQEGDVIIEVDGKKTKSTGHLRSQIGIKSIGDRVTLTLLRNGKKMKVRLTIGNPQSSRTVTKNQGNPLFEGVHLENNPNGVGVVVKGISPQSSAYVSGLRQGDVIIGVNREKVRDMTAFKRAIRKPAEKVLIHISRDGNLFYLVVP